jgi:arabinofuranosyltransferase
MREQDPERLRRQVIGTLPLFLALTVFLYRHFQADDAWIVLTVARNLLAGDGAGINPGEAVHVVSSPAWFGLGLLAQLLDHPDRPLAALAVLRTASLLASVAAITLTFALAKRHLPLRIAHWAPLLLCFDPWFGRWVVGGLEGPLALSVALAALWLRGDSRPVARLLAPALVLGPGLLVRPELALLGVILAIDLAWREPGVLRAVPRNRLVAWAGLLALPVAAWAAFAVIVWGEPLPQTGLVKRHALTVPAATLRALEVVVTSQFVALAALIHGALSDRGRPRPTEPPPPPTGVVLAWLVALVLFYVLQGYAPLSRYLLPATGCLPIVGLAAAARWFAGPMSDRWLQVVTIPATVIWSVLTLVVLAPASRGETVEAYREIAAWMADHTDEEARLATWEIGALAWFGERDLVDLGGLALPEELLELKDRPRALLRATRPEYSLLRYEIEGVSWEPVLTFDVHSSAAADPDPDQELVLWRLTWPTGD